MARPIQLLLTDTDAEAVAVGWIVILRTITRSADEELERIANDIEGELADGAYEGIHARTALHAVAIYRAVHNYWMLHPHPRGQEGAASGGAPAAGPTAAAGAGTEPAAGPPLPSTSAARSPTAGAAAAAAKNGGRDAP